MKAKNWSVLVICAALLWACEEDNWVPPTGDDACRGLCGPNEHCITALVAKDGVRAGEAFCSACQKDCAADKDHPVCVAKLGVCGASAACLDDQTMSVESGVAVCKYNSGDGNDWLITYYNRCKDARDCSEGEYCIEVKYELTKSDIKVGEKFCSACPVDCDPYSGYPVCVPSIHACADQISCHNGEHFHIDGNTATCVSGTDKACNKDSDCETGYVCADGQCAAIPDSIQKCVSDVDCESGYICDASRICSPIAELEDKFRYVRIDDKSPACEKDKKTGLCRSDDPGADIDAVVLTKSDGKVSYAVSVVGYMRSDGMKAGERIDDFAPMATDPTRALGKPDAFTAYPLADGKCNYYMNAARTEHPYVSLGGLGGYVALEMANAIEAGDKIDVLEVGACELQNTKDGAYQIAKSEGIQIQISVSRDSGWKVIGEQMATDTNKGILSFTVSPNMLK
ncbi:MAG: hypothetical protein IJM59_03830 [Proteobacteria bacterium]|nr:hypothetical protein [Pseudomonadota bacterium]